MKGRNDIFNPVVRAFILSLINDIVARTREVDGKDVAGVQPVPPGKSILSQPDKLNALFQKFYIEE